MRCLILLSFLLLYLSCNPSDQPETIDCITPALVEVQNTLYEVTNDTFICPGGGKSRKIFLDEYTFDYFRAKTHPSSSGNTIAYTRDFLGTDLSGEVLFVHDLCTGEKDSIDFRIQSYEFIGDNDILYTIAQDQFTIFKSDINGNNKSIFFQSDLMLGGYFISPQSNVLIQHYGVVGGGFVEEWRLLDPSGNLIKTLFLDFFPCKWLNNNEIFACKFNTEITSTNPGEVNVEYFKYNPFLEQKTPIVATSFFVENINRYFPVSPVYCPDMNKIYFSSSKSIAEIDITTGAYTKLQDGGEVVRFSSLERRPGHDDFFINVEYQYDNSAPCFFKESNTIQVFDPISRTFSNLPLDE